MLPVPALPPVPLVPPDTPWSVVLVLLVLPQLPLVPLRIPPLLVTTETIWTLPLPQPLVRLVLLVADNVPPPPLVPSVTLIPP